MRRRLISLVVICNILLLVVLAVSVLPLTKSRVLEEEEARLRAEIITIGTFIVETSPTITEIAEVLTIVDTDEGTRLAVFDGSVAVGRDAARFDGWPGRRSDGRPLHRTVIERIYPRFFTEANGDRIGSEGVSDGFDVWVIQGTIPAGHLAAEERQQWAHIGLYYLLGFLVSLAAAGILAQRLIRPVKDAVSAAEAIGRSDFRTQVPTEGPAEIIALRRALQLMGQRIEALIAGERERAAYLSHTLRTPLTAITLEVKRLQKATVPDLSQLNRNIADLERSLDTVIQRSRQTRSHGVATTCDAHQVLRSHLTYWAELADLQSRPVHEDICTGTSIVALSEQDLGNVLDVLLSNIFRHTAAESGYTVRMTRTPTSVTIAIGNPLGEVIPEVTGSSGLGLAFARMTVTSVGGSFSSNFDQTGGGGEVTFTLGLVSP